MNGSCWIPNLCVTGKNNFFLLTWADFSMVLVLCIWLTKYYRKCLEYFCIYFKCQSFSQNFHATFWQWKSLPSTSCWVVYCVGKGWASCFPNVHTKTFYKDFLPLLLANKFLFRLSSLYKQKCFNIPSWIKLTSRSAHMLKWTGSRLATCLCRSIKENPILNWHSYFI